MTGRLIDLVRVEYVAPHVHPRQLDRNQDRLQVDMMGPGDLTPVCQRCVKRLGLDVKYDAFEVDTADDVCAVCGARGRKPTDDDWKAGP